MSTQADHFADSKLPKITASFWVMKIAATTLGETAGDLVSMTLKVGYAISSLVLVSAFLVSLLSQLAVKRYLPWLYWTVILTTSTAGTTMSDYMDRSLGLGYARGAAVLVTILLCLFAACEVVDWVALGRSREDAQGGSLLLDHDPLLEHAGHGAR